MYFSVTNSKTIVQLARVKSAKVGSIVQVRGADYTLYGWAHADGTFSGVHDADNTLSRRVSGMLTDADCKAKLSREERRQVVSSIRTLRAMA